LILPHPAFHLQSYASAAMPPPVHPAGVIVLCPMKIERRAVARAMRAAGLEAVPIVQTGIGRHAVVAALARAVSAGEVTAAVLAGACGALSAVEAVPPISRVIDARGHEWRSPLPHPARDGAPGITLIGVDHVVSTPGDKAALAAATGAAIVDMESHAFAAECQRLRIAWAVVRGVSDTPLETLPHEVLAWINPDGDPRAWRAARDLTLRPRLLPHMARVLARSARVLPEVGAAVASLVVGLTHPTVAAA
jgi:hypothetical protein